MDPWWSDDRRKLKGKVEVSEEKLILVPLCVLHPTGTALVSKLISLVTRQ
jgi:hypothetical protein